MGFNGIIHNNSSDFGKRTPYGISQQGIPNKMLARFLPDAFLNSLRKLSIILRRPFQGILF